MEEIKNFDNENETMIWLNKKTLKNYKILPEFIYTLKNDKKISYLIFNKLNKQN